MGERFVVSVRHGSLKSHIRSAPGASRARLLEKGPGFVLYALMDFIVDQYLPIVEAMEEQLEQLEEEIFAERMTRETTNRIYELKRDLLGLKRAVSPVVDICNRLMRFDITLVPDDTRPYFRDVYDHVAADERDDRQPARAPRGGARSQPVADFGVAERRHQAARRMGRDHRRADDDRWRLRHELQVHARAAMGYGYYVVMAVMSVVACLAFYTGFKRSGWL